ncbi:hypothetical protein [Flavobacterium undicola]|uniref:hypothetical protein n=1 Tax=Flavobacterium undicola TaxID=1932779 RepID=UPI00137717CF|nr:hypothetical protein [Flavobacterium undicola]MBA0883160.1 hypothetical protein [Flavobacterium undicola]
MKKLKLLLLPILFSAFVGCENNDPAFPASKNPDIVVASNEIYGGPNRKFEIKASLTDDIGLKTIEIRIPELDLIKTITFTKDPLVTEFDLNYKFLVPSDKAITEKFQIELILTDVSENVVTKNISLRLDGDFVAPKLTNIKPVNNSVVFKTSNTKVPVSFHAEDYTGIDNIVVSCPELGINDVVAVGGLKSYDYNKTFSIPSVLKSYDISITVKDNFLSPNQETTKVSFTVADGLTSMFLADVPVGSSLTNDAFGVPMLFHKKVGNVFTFKYYADSNNKKIFFLGQDVSFEPHTFGLSSTGSLQNSTTSNPIILPTKGYYEITVNPIDLVYTVTPYTPTSTPINLSTTPITICGNGIVNGGWDPNSTALAVSADPSNPYRLTREITLNGTTVAMTITGNGWYPFWRLDNFAVAPYLGGGNANYSGVAAGTYIFTLDTELERTTLVKK